MKKIVTSKKIKDFEIHLRNEERSKATIEKYMRDVRYFTSFVGDAEIDKQKVLDYKNKLSDRYAVASANSMILRSLL